MLHRIYTYYIPSQTTPVVLIRHRTAEDLSIHECPITSSGPGWRVHHAGGWLQLKKNDRSAFILGGNVLKLSVCHVPKVWHHHRSAPKSPKNYAPRALSPFVQASLPRQPSVLVKNKKSNHVPSDWRPMVTQGLCSIHSLFCQQRAEPQHILVR